MVSMMRYFCLLLLVGAAVSIPLSPLTDLPPAYDDMLFNQLQGRLGETLVASAQVTKEYSRLATIEEVSAELSKYFPEVSPESVVYIHRAFSEINEYMIENHMVQSAQSEQQKSSSLLAQVLVWKQKIRLVMIKISHKSYQPNYIHLVYKSPYGTAPREFAALIGTLPACAQKSHHFIFFDTLFSSLYRIRGSQMSYLLAKGALGQTTFTGVLDAIQAVASAWQSIASAFKTVNRETFKYVIKGQGFSKFQQSSIFSKYTGIDLRKWDQFKPIYMTANGMDSPAKAKQEANVFLTLAEFMPDNVWQFNDHTFDKNGQGSTSTMVAFTKADLDVQKAHILTVVTTGTYQLAPDVYVYEKYKSVAGGIYQSTKEVRKNVPRNLSLNDIKGINAMAMLNAIKMMADHFKIDFKLPSDDPLKL